MNWHEYVAEAGKLPEWPYEVNYGRENTVESDVLVVGGGVAGCRAAIAALKAGATVAVADRGFSKRSGAGGAGVDHWHGAVTNPCSKITPKMYSEAAMEVTDGYTNGMARYIVGKEGWDAVQEIEKMGVQIRDEDDEFKGSLFRDDETKLMFAYDIVNRHCLRIYGYSIKPCVDREMRRLGAKVYDRICITALLTEDGKQGTRAIGAMGIHDRTGEFYIFKAKSVVIATGGGARLWYFAPEITESQTMSDMNQTGAGQTIAWKAGAELVMLESMGHARLSGAGYAPYSTGNCDNTYQGAPIVDATGKQIPHADAFGNLLTEERQIFEPSDPEKYVIGHGIMLDHGKDKGYKITGMDPKIGEKIRSGEYKLPFYTDFTILSKESRDIIFRMMLAHEGKCRVPIYKNFTQAGFDPAHDLLQYPVADYGKYPINSSWGAPVNTPANWRSGGGGLLTDWRFQSTSLPGLFGAGGSPLFGAGCHGESQTSGRYAGRQAAVFAGENPAVEPDRAQIDSEKARVYAPIGRKGGDVGWKELNYALARVMQDYCGDMLTEEILELGIKRLDDLLTTEGERTYVTNPHELARLNECFNLIEKGKAHMQAAKARKCSLSVLNFNRIDYPEVDPPEWHCHMALSQKDGKVRARKVPVDYYLQEPYSSDLEENYRKFAELEAVK